MNFSQRLKRYLIGVSIGTVLSIWIFRDKGDAVKGWMPNDRVLLRLKSTQLQVSEKIKYKMDCLSVSDKDVTRLLENGNVVFDESKTHQTPLIYVVEGTTENDLAFKTIFEAGDSTSVITNIILTNSDKDCDNL